MGRAWRRGDAQAARRQALVAQLAAATGAQLVGDPAVLAAAPAVTLHWRGRDTLALWAALLDGHANHAVQCEGQACRVWLLASGTQAGAAGQARSGQAPAHLRQAPQPDPPGLFPAE
ncbi:MAG: hypothetical protein CFE45_25805 [Burkholderiales bacterium PBB5]|nr:MAG: hypothetical protein CFE45_25805 [Burkholderiales bacterium PBB5]